MIIRTLSFTVTPTATEPQTVQQAGTTGDHLATRLEITVPHTDLSYRLELTDGGGGYDTTTLLTPDGDCLVFDLPCSWTAAGIASVRVVAVERDGECEVMRYHYPPFYLQFEERDDGEATGEVFLSEWQEVLTTAEFLNAEFERRMLSGEFKGDKGDKGDTGSRGPEGPQGPEGPMGQNGLPGVGVTDAFIDPYGNLVINYSNGTGQTVGNVVTDLSPFRQQVEALDAKVSGANERVDQLILDVGDIDAALDGILAVQESFIGGASV